MKKRLSIQKNKSQIWIIALLIAFVTCLFYLPTINNEFVNWDDSLAIIENPMIRSFSFSSIHEMATSFLTGNWIPLTWLSFALDYSIGKLNPAIYHGHNLLLHLTNTVLVFFLSLNILKLVSQKDTLLGKKLFSFSEEKYKEWKSVEPATIASAITALLFGLHPIHVESVAWATERKDLLFCAFFFGSLLIYLNNVNSKNPKKWKWIACLVFFALSLLSKPMGVTLPLILFLLDVWPLKRFQKEGFLKLFYEKIPFFILSILFSIIALFAQSHAGAVQDIDVVPLSFRIMNAFHSLVFYIWKMIIPINLVPFYPLLHGSILTIQYFLACCLVFFVSLTCYYYREKKTYLWVSWLFYVITLLPVIGLLQVGAQAAADRYTYLPSLSILLLFSTSFVIFLSHHRKVLLSSSLFLIFILGWATIEQIELWKNSITLWEKTKSLYPNQSIIIHANMGNAYRQFGHLDKALEEYNQALALYPHPLIYEGRGNVLLDKGHVDEAIQDFQYAIGMQPNEASFYRNLWFAYDKKGAHDLALVEIQEAIRQKPLFHEAYNSFGITLGKKGDFAKSLAAFHKALEIEEGNDTYLINLATTYQRSGQLDEAIAWYKKGLQYSKNPICFINLAHTYLLKGMIPEMIQTLEAGARMHPTNKEIFYKLGLAYEKIGQLDLAQRNYAIVKQMK